MALIIALRKFEGALMIITHDRFFMRCVVEGDSPTEDSDDSDEEQERKGGFKPKPGVVYRLVKGEIKLLDGGMRKYEALASKKIPKPRS
jgi:ATP-binding cassette subfamily F protein 3